MCKHTLRPINLTQKSFAEYGDVIDIEYHNDIKSINYGMTDRYHNLAKLDLLEGNGTPLFNIFKARPVNYPFKIQMLERHPISSQLFYPMSDQPFLVLVANHQDSITVNTLKLFITNGRQGINYKRNTWHHYLLAISENSGFIVVDRGGNDKNCEEFYLDEEIFIELA